MCASTGPVTDAGFRQRQGGRSPAGRARARRRRAGRRRARSAPRWSRLRDRRGRPDDRRRGRGRRGGVRLSRCRFGSRGPRGETAADQGRAAALAQGIRLPADTPDALAKAMLVRDAKNLEEYLQKYEITLSVLQTAAALERVAYEFVIDKAAENLRYVEVRYSPLLHRPALTLAQAIEAPLAGIRRAAAETGTKVGLIVCAMRTKPPPESLELARVAAEYHTAGVTAFDLAGAERGFPARDHRAAFEYAATHGMACTCHAGEGDGPHSIDQALHECGAQRIGHGTRLLEDTKLLDEVVQRRIPLEMCLTSNVHTHVVASVAEHPFKRYLQQGVVVTLNTDGPLTDGITLTDEYFLAHAVLGLSPDELQRVVLNTCESAFLPEYEKVALVSRVQSELGAL